MTDDKPDTFRKAAERTAEDERAIQAGIDRQDAAVSNDDDGPKAMQAGAREYPVPDLPQQHLKKPGLEADLKLEPMYDAPFYRGSGKLEGCAALITGADSGIGRAVAVLYAREGCDVAIAYLNEDEDAQATKAAVEKEGRRAILLPGDVADPDYARHAVAKTLEAFGRLDVLVNNAAFQEHAGDLEQITDAHFDRTLKTNLYGYFYMARAAVPHMKPGGAILMTGSVVGLQGSGELLDYGMTKGGIHAFARSLSAQLIPKGIRVNVVAPGPVWTPLNPADRPDVSKFGSGVPMGRPAQPEEIAPAFVFLASPQMSSYITGEILPVIGGY
ncbi:MAG: SDR family oxidoreductase [Phenylobacterium sp.]|uniref:SDR family oxidoreductase n=1 Tax=Phenylobacterium sp. TaxID=1871053 RepID=UPI00271A08A4|nr:SDR family oxidoreductase [Phenylobacterium sp.]MDO8410638.1 SDR family oxidoreductase [Phenylobacterium sp.]